MTANETVRGCLGRQIRLLGGSRLYRKALPGVQSESETPFIQVFHHKREKYIDKRSRWKSQGSIVQEILCDRVSG